jgi:hypothetical protein
MNKSLFLASALVLAAGAIPGWAQSLPPTHECPPTTATGTTGSATGPASSPGASAQVTVPGTPPAAAQGNAAAPTIQQDGKAAMAQTDCPNVPTKMDRLKQ